MPLMRMRRSERANQGGEKQRSGRRSGKRLERGVAVERQFCKPCDVTRQFPPRGGGVPHHSLAGSGSASPVHPLRQGAVAPPAPTTKGVPAPRPRPAVRRLDTRQGLAALDWPTGEPCSPETPSVGALPPTPRAGRLSHRHPDAGKEPAPSCTNPLPENAGDERG